jgi:hypothetical protein
MQMIIERRGADIRAARLLLQDAMDLAHRDGRIRQMLQHLCHHHGIKALIPEIDRGGEVHFVAGHAGLARGFERALIDIDADP